MNSLWKRQQLALIIGFLIVQFAAVPTLFRSSSDPKPTVLAEEAIRDTIPRVDPFAGLSLDGAAAYVLDLRTGTVLYEKNSAAELPLASLAKLMTALLAAESLEQTELVTITSEALAKDGDYGFYAGEQFEVGDLVEFTLVSSSNDGAHALAEALVAGQTGVNGIAARMNARAAELGLRNTRFANSTGLDEENASLGGAYGSARDVALLIRHILREHPELLESTRQSSVSISSTFGFVHTAENTNMLVEDIPWLIGSKTGFTNLAGGNLALAFDAGLGHPVIVVVLGSTKENRFTDTQKLIERTLGYFEQERFISAPDSVE
jgi:D-alanyl-D-alanine carboxypeptidase (penicillin-binding protein 5/6)